MATDISGSVSAEYTAAVPVPDDGDATNGAGLVAFALPLANRIEFLNSQLNTAPWIAPSLFDDFITAEIDTTAGYIRSQEIWRLDENGNHSHGTASGLAPTIGELSIVNLTASAGETHIRTANAITISRLTTITIRLRVDAIVAGQDIELSLNFDSSRAIPNPTSSNLVRLLCEDSGSWVLETHDGTSSTVALPTSTLVAGTYMQLQLIHDGAGGWSARADTGTPAVAVANIPDPTSQMQLSLRFMTPTAGTRGLDVDFIHVGFLSAGRVL
jgi:hypothetical protein